MLHLCTNTFSQSALFQFAVLRLTSDICSRLHLNIATMKQILHSRNLRNWQVSERLKPLELETEAINATWRAPVANDDAQRLKDAEAFMNAYKRDLAATDRRYGWDMALLVYPENPTDLDYGVHRWSIETLKIRTGKAMFMAHMHYDASIEDEISKLYHLIAANPWEKHWPNIRSSKHNAHTTRIMSTDWTRRPWLP
ncbi:hypothetical protein VTP01DRAFT_6129 [Rhizomucor pusillus]|uniref:uncharacterized protein n=1 Tax=Rhizomucor pusillus TaxID=4840 RepID=UPI003742610F